MKIIVLTLDALTPSALGCYGSSWNTTPTIDSLAAGGCLWDRLITSDTDPATITQQWFGNAASGVETSGGEASGVETSGGEASGVETSGGENGADRWINAWKKHGSVELLSDSQSAISIAAKSDFDQIYQIDPVHDALPPQPATEIEGTQFAQLIAAAVQRINEGDDWGLLWLHSDFLAKIWDAPRWLVEPESIEEFGVEPMDEAETLEAEMMEAAEAMEDSLEELPVVFDTVTPPKEPIPQNAHPDLIATWMRTYGCQVRLVDELLNVLLTALGQTDVTIVLAGSSGESLGQNGWVGHQAGPLRSCHVSVPLIVSQRGPLRMPQICSENEMGRLIECLSHEDAALISPRDWSRDNQAEADSRLIRHSELPHQAILTSQWLFVDQGDQDYRLFLKPDDINDFNDISRLRHDVVEEFVAATTNS